jgi:hypothetical protein
LLPEDGEHSEAEKQALLTAVEIMVPTPSLLSALAVRFYTEEDKTVNILGDSLRYDTCIYLCLNHTMERANSAVIEGYGFGRDGCHTSRN